MRIERDSMGEMQVPESALYGASTQRAVLNFEISKLRLQEAFISSIGLIKLAACRTNLSLGLLPKNVADAIESAAKEVMDNKLDQHFVVDVFQTGSGTSTNMNANEVIANRAAQIMGGKLGEKSLVHPNDHVNMAQSSNDVIPTAIHISAMRTLTTRTIPGLKALQKSLVDKSIEFADVIKSGRTHLQDATPITLGQEFGGYAAQIANGISRLERAQVSLAELALGGTAVGTGLNTHPEFAKQTITEVNKITGLNFVEASNHFEAQGARDAIVELSGQLKTIACSLIKIANDIRWLAAGPRCSLGEINLPEIQPGSSIMPAKVNPVICESVMMVAAKIIGNDSCISVCGQHGNFELNVMMPIMAYDIIESLDLMASVANNFVNKCVKGITVNREKCREYAENSLAICTALAPVIGYDKSAKMAKKAFAEGKSIRTVLTEEQIMSNSEIDKILDLFAMTKPGSN